MSSLLRLCRTALLPGGTEGILLLPTEVGLRSVATLEPPMSGAHPAIPAGEYDLRLDVPLAPLSAFAPSVVESVERTPAAFGRCPRSCRHSHPSRQSPLRLLGLPPRRSCRRCPPPCRQCRHLPPPDADSPRPSCTSPPPSGVGRPRSAHFFPTTPTPLASACFCLGLNVCFMPRKKLHPFV